MWIFARHSLYPTFSHPGTVVGIIAPPRSAARRLPGQAEHDRGALDGGLRDHDPRTDRRDNRRGRRAADVVRCGTRDRAGRSTPAAPGLARPSRTALSTMVALRSGSGAQWPPMGVTVNFRVRGQADGTGRATAPSDRTSSGLTSPMHWSPRRPSTPVISWSRSERAVAPARSCWMPRRPRASPWKRPALGGSPTARGGPARGRGHLGRVLRRPAVPHAAPAVPGTGLTPLRHHDRVLLRHLLDDPGAAGSNAAIWSSSGRWPASGRPCLPRRCSPPRGCPGGPSRSAGALPRCLPARAGGRRGGAPGERRTPPLLPAHMAPAYADFVRGHWK